ncbi:MAG: GntR family transcriptional regulator [Victivallaceae bacterium]
MKNVSRQNHQLLHMQIKDAILKKYADRGVTENMPFPSVRELVKQFNTSIVTIEKTLRELKKDGIIYSVPDVGTFWGKQRPLARYKTVGVYFDIASPDYIAPDTYFFYMLRGIEFIFEKYDFHTKLLRFRSMASMPAIRELHCDAVICAGTYPSILPTVKIFQKLNLPYLLLDRPNNDDNLNYLERDSVRNLEELTDYLISLGHRKICCMGTSPELWISRKLYFGFEAAMRKHHLDISGSILQLPNFSRETIAESRLKDVIRKHSALIILHPNKKIVGEILKYCEFNRIGIPEDCSVVSLASEEMNIGKKTVTSHLTTPYEMGVKAAEGIVALLHGTVAAPLHIEFPLNINVGNTATAFARK